MAQIYIVTLCIFAVLIVFVILLRTETKKVESATVAIVDKAWMTEVNKFVAEKGMNDEIAILINLGIHSGLPRLVVWDLKAETVLHSALVSHGCGPNGVWNSDLSKDAPVLSNIPDSHASSIGRYRIGDRGYSNWGVHIKYLLHGLDATNNNALRRVIVLHGWEAVPDDTIYPKGTPEGWGCPAVSNATMRYLDEQLRFRRDVLMWVKG